MTQGSQNLLRDIANSVMASSTPNPVIKEAWFNAKVLNLDGYVFEQCRFDGCTLQIASLNFKLANCWVSKDCRVVFLGRTLSVIQLYLHQFELDRSQFGVLLPQLHPDGTISIG